MKYPRIKISIAPINVITNILKIFLNSSLLKNYNEFIETNFLIGPQRKNLNPISLACGIQPVEISAYRECRGINLRLGGTTSRPEIISCFIRPSSHTTSENQVSRISER